MLERLLSALLAPCCTAALLACVPGPSASSVASASNVASGTPVKAHETVAGQWDIVSFQDHTVQRRLQGTGRATYVDFTGDHVALNIGCNSSGATGRVVDGRFRATPGDRIQTLVGCGKEREARDAALFAFFERTPAVEQLSDGRLKLTAGKDVLLLERPESRRLAFLPTPAQLLGEWRMVEITHYIAGGGIASIGLSGIDGMIEFDGIEARYTACPTFAVRYRYAPEGRIEKLSGPTVPTEPGACGALQAERYGRDMPRPWDALRVLHANPLVELVDEQTVLLSTERYGLLLTKRQVDS